MVENFIGHFEIGENVQGVGVVIEQVMQLEDLAGDGEIADDTGGLGNGDEFFRNQAQAGAAQQIGDGAEFVRGGEDQMLVGIALHIVRTGFDGGVHDPVFGDLRGGDVDLTLAVELIGNTAGRGDAATVFRKNGAHVLSGPVDVVSGHFDDECDACGAVTFVGNFLNHFAAEFSRAFFDGAVDVILGHGDCLGIVDGGTETGVGTRISTTGTGGECDFVSALAEDPALDGIDSGFDVFDLGPLIVTGHKIG